MYKEARQNLEYQKRLVDRLKTQLANESDVIKNKYNLSSVKELETAREEVVAKLSTILEV